MPVQLVQTPIPPDLRAASRDIADGIESGQIVGLGIVVMLKNRRFFVDAFGTLVRDPHAARGYVRSLDDCLRAIGEGRTNSNTTL
jgi:hypothetical protein